MPIHKRLAFQQGPCIFGIVGIQLLKRLLGEEKFPHLGMKRFPEQGVSLQCGAPPWLAQFELTGRSPPRSDASNSGDPGCLAYRLRKFIGRGISLAIDPPCDYARHPRNCLPGSAQSADSWRRAHCLLTDDRYQRFFQTGLRFSAKARGPSMKSSVLLSME